MPVSLVTELKVLELTDTLVKIIYFYLFYTFIVLILLQVLLSSLRWCLTLTTVLSGIDISGAVDAAVYPKKESSSTGNREGE